MCDQAEHSHGQRFSSHWWTCNSMSSCTLDEISVKWHVRWTPVASQSARGRLILCWLFSGSLELAEAIGNHIIRVPCQLLCSIAGFLSEHRLSMVVLTRRNKDDNHKNKMKRIPTNTVVKDNVCMILIFTKQYQNHIFSLAYFHRNTKMVVALLLYTNEIMKATNRNASCC